jgi:hypothetical protein
MSVTIQSALPADGVSPSGTLTNTTGLIRLTISLAALSAPGSWQLIKQNADTTKWAPVEGASLSVDNIGEDGKDGTLLWEDKDGGALYHVIQTRPTIQNGGSVLSTATGYLTAATAISGPTLGASTVSTLKATGAATFDSTVSTAGKVTMTGGLDLTGTTGIDASGNSGTLKTPTGTNTIGGTLSMAAGKSISFAAGAGGFDGSSGTGDFKPTTGDFTHLGAAGKNISIKTQTTGTIAIDNADAWSIGATGGLTGTIGRTGQAVTFPGKPSVTQQFSANGGTQSKGAAPTAAADAVMYGVADINGGGTAAEVKNYEGGASLTERVNGTGASKHIILSEDVADDGTVTLPVPASGKVGILEISEITEWGKYSVQNDGTVTKLDGSTNAVTTDTDTKFCVFKDTSTPTIKNRLGATKPIVGTYRYY